MRKWHLTAVFPNVVVVTLMSYSLTSPVHFSGEPGPKKTKQNKKTTPPEQFNVSFPPLTVNVFRIILPTRYA